MLGYTLCMTNARRLAFAVAALTLSACSEGASTQSASYSLGGEVRNLGGQLILTSGGVTVTVAQNGNFAFPVLVTTGTYFAVTVDTQPDGQQCTVFNGVDVMGNQNVTGVVVDCVQNYYVLGGKVTGLDGAPGNLTLANGNDRIVMNGSGIFNFPTHLPWDAQTNVSVVQSPNGWTCSVAQTTPVIQGDSSDVTVLCSPSVSVGGNVQGATGALILANGSTLVSVPYPQTRFVFPGVISDSVFDISVVQPPSGQTCAVTQGTGVAGPQSANQVSVVCQVAFYTLTGTATGHSGTLLINNPGSASYPLSPNNNIFQFGGLQNGQVYGLVVTPPAGQACYVTGPSTGLIDSASVQGINITCFNQVLYSVGGTVVGATGPITLLNNVTGSTDTRTLQPNNGDFNFPVYGGARYNIVITSQPPGQSCRVVNGSAQLGQGSVSNVKVYCFSPSLVGTVSGNTTDGLILEATQNSNTFRVQVAANANAFSIGGYLPGDAYSVGVYSSALGTKCTLSGTASGNVPESNVTGLSVSCVPRTYQVWGGVVGLSGSETITVGLQGSNPARTQQLFSGQNQFKFDSLPNNTSVTLEVTSNSTGRPCVWAPSATFPMHSVNVNGIVVDCSSNTRTVAQVPNNTPVYNFDTSTQTWTKMLNVTAATVQVDNGPLPPAPVYQGAGVLEFSFTHPGDGSCTTDVKNNSGPYGGQATLLTQDPTYPLMAKPGSYVTFHVWMPARAPALFIQPFVLSNSGAYGFSGTFTDANSGFFVDSWTEVIVPVPFDATSITTMGVTACFTADYTGSIFVDSIDYPLQ